MDIRYGRPNDRKTLENLQLRSSTVWPEYREQILQHPDSIDVPPNLLSERRVRVAERNEMPVGFAVVLAPNDRISELDGLFVDPAHWRQGIATALMRDAVELARAEDAIAIEVTANPLAREFYDKFGFTQIGEASTRFGPALRMRYSLVTVPPRATRHRPQG
jgi:ribosomal protein S18 acetylase RimI-like enzyme